jgi:restriction endonuclease Mrr
MTFSYSYSRSFASQSVFIHTVVQLRDAKKKTSRMFSNFVFPSD